VKRSDSVFFSPHKRSGTERQCSVHQLIGRAQLERKSTSPHDDEPYILAVCEYETVEKYYKSYINHEKQAVLTTACSSKHLMLY